MNKADHGIVFFQLIFPYAACTSQFTRKRREQNLSKIAYFKSIAVQIQSTHFAGMSISRL